MANAGESGSRAPWPGDTEPSSQIKISMKDDHGTPGRDVTERLLAIDAREATAAAESTHPDRQQVSPEQWRLFQIFLSQQSSSSVPAEHPQKQTPAAMPPAITSTTAILPGTPPVMCNAAHEECVSATLANERFTLKTEPGFSNRQQSDAHLSLGTSLPGSTTYSQRLGSTRSDSLASFSSRGTKRNRSVFSHSDDDDDDDVDTELFTRYDPANERLPKTQIHHPKFREAEECLTGIYERLLSIQEQYADKKDSDIEFTKSSTRQSSGIKYPGEIIVGFKGASGMGKSSLLNSLLGIEDAALVGHDAKACTAAVQEFRYSGSQGTFGAEVEFIHEDARKEALENYISDFFFHHDHEIDVDDPQYEDLIKPYSTCIEALTSMFCDHEAFSSEDSIEQYIRKFSGPSAATLKTTLMSWLNKAMKSLNVCSDSIKFSATTASELSDMVKPFLTFDESELASETPRPSLWPVVKVVRVFCDSPILSQGIVLTDLPGSGDTNRTRMAATSQYMRGVDYTVVVSDTKRCLTNDSIHEDIVSAYRRTRHGGAALVLTRTDDVDLNALGERNPTGFNPRDAKNITHLRLQSRAVHERLTQIKAQVSMARDGGMLDKERVLSAEQEQCELDLVNSNNAFYDACIRSRNSMVAQGFEKKYRGFAKGKIPLAVYCVSNRLYNQHLEGVERGQEIKMHVETTGIPALRAQLYCLPAQKRFRALEQHCGPRLDGYFCIVEMICNNTKLKRKEDMEQILLGPKEFLFKDIGLAFQKFKEQAIIPALEKIKNSREKWIGLTQPKLEEWSKWHPRTFGSTLRLWGKCKNKKHPANWNAELLKFVARDLEKEMEVFENPQESLTPILKSLFDKVIDSIQQSLEEAAGPAEDLSIFFRTLSTTKLKLHDLSEDIAGDLEEDLLLIKENMLSVADENNSYFLANMKSTYEECFRLKGTRIHDVRVKKFAAKINDTSKGPFMAINDRARRATNKLLSDHVNVLTDAALEIFGDMKRLFSSSFNTAGGNTPAAKEIRRILRHEVGLARELSRGHLQDCLDECRSCGNQGASNPRVKREPHSPC